MMAFSRDCDVIVAVGSGTLNDLCKFSSFQLGLDYMVFATAPSMDGFVSIGAALITNYVKTTYQAHVPLAVIGDTDILAAAPMEMMSLRRCLVNKQWMGRSGAPAAPEASASFSARCMA